MKLVDILARDLKVWPEGARFILFDGASGAYADMGIGYRNLPGIDAADCDIAPHIAGVTRDQWQAARDALKHERLFERHIHVGPVEVNTPAWTGEGLPPLGARLEYYTTDKGYSWCEGVVSYIGPKFIVITYEHPEFGESESCMNHARHDAQISTRIRPIRPIRTPEQIAAEERENAACELYCTINWHGGVPEWKNQTADRRNDYFKAIDAGYRKEKK